ncbi:MAG: tetratricopeptide repeat protein [Candidatus Hydrogenedens sp.]|nr:tetratricopeptide repeat protein [Candidatus Hydrogenedens sp.]
MKNIKYIFLFTALVALGSLVLLRYYVFSTPPPLSKESPPTLHSAVTAKDRTVPAGADSTTALNSTEEDSGQRPHSRENSGASSEEKTAEEPSQEEGKSKDGTAKPSAPKAVPADDKQTQAARLVEQATRYIQRENYEQAEALLRESLDLYKENPSAWRQLTGLYRKSGEMDMELAAYLDWSRAMPGNMEALLGLADVHFRQGDYEAARKLLVRTERETRELNDYGRIASLYRKMDDPFEEGRILSEWKQRTPESQEARKHWAHYQRRVGDYQGALVEYGSLAEELPADASLHRRLGDVHRSMGAYNQASVYYETAIALQPQNSGLLFRLAETRLRMYDYDGAVEAWSTIIELQPGTPLAESAQRQIDELSSGMVEERQPW